MMRITFVGALLDFSGGARIIAGHAQRLLSRGHEVFVVAPTPKSPSFREKLKGLLQNTRRPIRSEHSHYDVAKVSFHLTGRAGPVTTEDLPDADVIVATWWETAEWIWDLPPSKGTKVHFIQHYEAFPGVPTERLEAVWRLPIPKIAVAQWLVDLGRERFGTEQIRLVPNSVEHELFSAERYSRGNPPTVGFLFHQAGFKDMPTTVATLTKLKQMQPGVQLISFGSSRPDEGQLPAETEFFLLPPQDEIAKIYARCDAWLSTSRTEGFNLPPLEAMASGCPAVCAKTGRPLEIIENGVNGYLVDAGDVDGFAHALRSIILAPDETWKGMSDAARRAVAHPTWEESSELFEEALVQAHAVRPNL